MSLQRWGKLSKAWVVLKRNSQVLLGIKESKHGTEYPSFLHIENLNVMRLAEFLQMPLLS